MTTFRPCRIIFRHCSDDAETHGLGPSQLICTFTDAILVLQKGHLISSWTGALLHSCCLAQMLPASCEFQFSNLGAAARRARHRHGRVCSLPAKYHGDRPLHSSLLVSVVRENNRTEKFLSIPHLGSFLSRPSMCSVCLFCHLCFLKSRYSRLRCRGL